MPKISIITPSVRLEFLDIVQKCLARQTFDDWEWIVVSPFEYKTHAIWVPDPAIREGDYYRLNGAWNAAFRKAKGELVVSIVDGLWFPPDTLERFWDHYEDNPKACVTTIGHQYDTVVYDKPENMVWRDPRAREDQGSFYEVPESEMELCVASFPMQAVIDVGGVDEEYDKGAACSEKEMMLRMYTAGYKLYIDQTIEYRAIQHPRISKEWDEKYIIACRLFDKHRKEIADGTRLKVDFV